MVVGVPTDGRNFANFRRGDEVWADRAEFAALGVIVDPNCNGNQNYVNVSIKSIALAFGFWGIEFLWEMFNASWLYHTQESALTPAEMNRSTLHCEPWPLFRRSKRPPPATRSTPGRTLWPFRLEAAGLQRHFSAHVGAPVWPLHLARWFAPEPIGAVGPRRPRQKRQQSISRHRGALGDCPASLRRAARRTEHTGARRRPGEAGTRQNTRSDAECLMADACSECRKRLADPRVHYRAFIDLWKNADVELQPRVTDARKRLARLTPVEKPRT